MNRELIDMDIKEAMKKVIDTLENHNTDAWKPDGYLDGRIHNLIQEAVVSAIPVSYTHLTLPTRLSV